MLPPSTAELDSIPSKTWEVQQEVPLDTGGQISSRRVFMQTLFGMGAGAALTYVITREKDEHPAVSTDETMLAIQEELIQCRERMFIARTLNDNEAINNEVYLMQWYEKRLQGILDQGPDTSSVRMLDERVNGRIATCTQLTHDLYSMKLSAEQQITLKTLLQEAQFLAHHSLSMDALLGESDGTQ
jgi:hypothetical protein